MPAYSASRLKRLYFQSQGANNFRTITQASGTWTNTGAQQILFENASMVPGNALITPPFKTGTASNIAGVRGRQDGTFSFSAPLIPSGTAGTKPNLDIFLASMVGRASVLSAGVSTTYSLADATIPFLALLYDEANTTLTQMYAMGCLPVTARITLNGDIAMISGDCQCVGVADSTNFSSYTGTVDAALLGGGLTTYPAEPTPSTTGSIINGFGGTISIDGSAIGQVRSSLVIELATGYEWVNDGFADGYRLIALNNARTASLSSLTILNSDVAALNNVKQKALTKAPMPVVITLGTVAGKILTINLNNVQFPQAAFKDNGAAVDVDFGGAAAHASSVGVTDDYTIVLT